MVEKARFRGSGGSHMSGSFVNVAESFRESFAGGRIEIRVEPSLLVRRNAGQEIGPQGWFLHWG